MVSLAELSTRKRHAQRRWVLWAVGLALGAGIGALVAGDAAPGIARFLIERVIEPFSQIAIGDFLCL